MSKKSLWHKRLTAVLAAGALLVTIPLAGCTKTEGENSKDGESKASVSETTEEKIPDTKFGDGIVAKSKTYKIKYSVMEYLLNYMFSNFYNNYGSSNYFDTTKDLKKQSYNGDENMTWFDYFTGTTKNYLTQVMVFSEGAKEAGLKLSSADESTLSEGFSMMESVAAESSMTVDEFIKSTYGSHVTKADVEEIQRMTVLAQNYNNYLMDSFKYTDEQYEAQYAKDKNTYRKADYLVYSFPYTTDSTDEEKAKLKEYADGLANCKDQKEFNEYLKNYLNENRNLVSITQNLESSLTEAEFNSAIDAQIESTVNTGVSYNDSNDAYKWIFSEDRKTGDTTSIDLYSSYNTIMILKPIYRDETETRNVRHILITESTEGSDAAAKKKAESILKEWEDGAHDEEFFGDLASKYSEDPGSKTKGGLYSGVTPGQMVAEFNDWLFNSKRKIGDSGIVKTTYGYHIMYYPGPGLKSWQNLVDADLRKKDLEDKYEEMKKEYNVEFDDDAISNMIIKMPATETSSEVPAETASSQQSPDTESSAESSTEESKEE